MCTRPRTASSRVLRLRVVTTAQLPTGTVTFLFTDIEGSTKLLSELGDDYAHVLLAHRRKLRNAFSGHRGFEVDTQGDAFFYAFAHASEAVAAAQEAQAALAEGPIRVRIGIHSGESRLTEEGYVGIDVHRAARICAAAHGGQVVLSERTRVLVDGFEFKDLGLHRLKDLGRPEKLFQASDEDFPPLRSLNATNLPSQPSQLIGRERELEELIPLVREQRLVNLTGPGGSGKTRLALQVAAELVDDFVDGVFWVPLAPLTDWELVEPTIAQTLGAKGGLVEHVDEKRMLLLLDNFEHLLPAATKLSDLTSACPSLHLLVTSRGQLRIAAEREYEVEPLPEPAAVRLFRERAAVSEPEHAVAEICRRLDGLPLAIELAAARTKVLPPEKLLDRLGQRLSVLTSGRRDAPDRQQTLRATIEWSYDLLSEDEQRLFADLAVFAGSFDLEGSERVCGAELDALDTLIDKSLLRRWASGRLGMLETIREFALEKLEETGEGELLLRRHADHFLGLAERAAPDLRQGRWGDWLDQLDTEHANLRAAIEWADRRGRDELKLRLLLALYHFWFVRGHLDEGGRRFDEAVNHAEATPDVRLQILGGAALFAYERGKFSRAASLLEQRLALAREVGDQMRVVDSLRILGTAQVELDNLPRARRLLEESVALAGQLPDDAVQVKILTTCDLGWVLLNEGEYQRAVGLYEEALTLSRERSDTRLESNLLESIGAAELRSGRPREATTRLKEALALAHGLGYDDGVISCLVVLAAAAAREDRVRRAAILLGAAETLQHSIGYSLQRVEREASEEAAAASRERLGTERFDSALAEGRMLSPDDAVAYARRNDED
jgi:predicted ATPase/class 3 adenylate cyclase